MTRYLTADPGILAIGYPDATVLIHPGREKVWTLHGPAHDLWNQGGPHLQDPGTADVDGLVKAGILHRTERPALWTPPLPGFDNGPAQSTHTVEVALPPPAGPLAGRVAAWIVLAAVAAIAGRGRRPFARHLRMVSAANTAARLLRSTPASSAEAARIVAQVRQVAATVPARTACLEITTAAVLLLAARRRTAVWCHGARPGPLTVHTWLEDANGEPVAELLGDTHTATLRIPASHPERHT
ncbi:lasso peptide biosynthesis B2 protein [Actinocorallia sp. A-T 12471]|uniref:lasso peptide biosynthesis B2 protein n=1 Tax=Actinocorallia sp. A-T 12471 TaxID=3089813 RepID=UPI0029CF22B3|nr:lasso peptide biosynthesis B2 protein [Actinocorallia sp. A-T 12471]MDX6744563.1 lasso peptide biosynthesis B2 protein [Actinocorallia sp. A-T 12471]